MVDVLLEPIGGTNTLHNEWVAYYQVRSGTVKTDRSEKNDTPPW